MEKLFEKSCPVLVLSASRIKGRAGTYMMHSTGPGRCPGSHPALPVAALGTTTKHLKSSGMNFFQPFFFPLFQFILEGAPSSPVNYRYF